MGQSKTKEIKESDASGRVTLLLLLATGRDGARMATDCLVVGGRRGKAAGDTRWKRETHAPTHPPSSSPFFSSVRSFARSLARCVRPDY